MSSPPHSSIEPMPGTGSLLAATSLALATLAPVAAHQLGRLKHLPDPPGRWFSSDRITASAMAHPFRIPDSLLGIASYSITLTLALFARRHTKARRLLALKLLGDGAIASANMVRQVVTFRRLCSWCTGTVLCTIGMLVAARSLMGAELSQPAPMLRTHRSHAATGPLDNQISAPNCRAASTQDIDKEAALR